MYLSQKYHLLFLIKKFVSLFNGIFLSILSLIYTYLFHAMSLLTLYRTTTKINVIVQKVTPQLSPTSAIKSILFLCSFKPPSGLSPSPRVGLLRQQQERWLLPQWEHPRQVQVLRYHQPQTFSVLPRQVNPTNEFPHDCSSLRELAVSHIRRRGSA